MPLPSTVFLLTLLSTYRWFPSALASRTKIPPPISFECYVEDARSSTGALCEDVCNCAPRPRNAPVSLEVDRLFFGWSPYRCDDDAQSHCIFVHSCVCKEEVEGCRTMCTKKDDCEDVGAACGKSCVPANRAALAGTCRKIPAGTKQKLPQLKCLGAEGQEPSAEYCVEE